MSIFRSLKKSRKILSISKILGAPFNASNFLSPNSLSKRDKALNELFSLCEKDSELRKIMGLYEVDKGGLEGIYKMLLANGAGQWKRGHYVPVSSFAFVHTFSFLLEQTGNLSWIDISILLLEYFEWNDVGPVPLKMRGPANPNDPLRAVWDMEQKLKGVEE